MSPSNELASVEDLVVAARSFASASRSNSTKRAYASDWRDFERWASVRNFDPLPADPAVVALYITDLASRLKPSTITRRLASISVVHQQAGYPSPTRDEEVRSISTGIRRTLGTAQREAAPLSLGDLRAMLAHLPDTVRGARDRALLVVGFAGAFRRSELVALDVGDLDRREEGVLASVRRSKTDQEGGGRQVALPYGKDRHTCPVTALDAWMVAAELHEGPLFVAVDRHGHLGGRLTPASVNLIVKDAAQRARLDPARLSGHSLRAGFATTAAAAGASERAIANQTGHRSMNVLRRYVRHGSAFTDNAATQIGL